MFRSIIDDLMTSPATPAVVLLIYVIALAAGWRGHLRPAIIVNLASAITVLTYSFPGYGTDPPLPLFYGFEALVLLASAAALAGLAIPRWLAWSAFAINLALWLALIAFLLTFKMRMF